jgi:hypothetical protein
MATVEDAEKARIAAPTASRDEDHNSRN